MSALVCSNGRKTTISDRDRKYNLWEARNRLVKRTHPRCDVPVDPAPGARWPIYRWRDGEHVFLGEYVTFWTKE